MGVWAARIWLRVSSVGIPRSITQVRWAFPYCFSILYQKVGQGGLVRGIPRHDLIGQWKTVRSHDQGEHHLHAIWTFVAAVTKFSFTFLGRIRFKIGTAQIVEQHLKPTSNSACQRCLREVNKSSLWGNSLSEHRYSLSICTR